MRAMRRASTPSAAIRAVSSSPSHAVDGGLAGVGLGVGGGSSVSRNGIFNCMFALPTLRRLALLAEKSVENCTQLAKIGEMSERGCTVDIVATTLQCGSARFVPIGPSGRDQ